MRKTILILILSISTFAYSQDYQVVKFDKVEDVINSKSDTLYILNFWATWCQPCVKELPYFEAMNKKYKDKKVKIILISMDFKSDLQKRLEPFLEKKKMKTKVWFLDETNQNDFIPKVEDKWSGAIPFTLFTRGSDGFRFWQEGEFTKEELDNRIDSNL